MSWLLQNAGTILVGIVLAVVIFMIVRKRPENPRAGRAVRIARSTEPVTAPIKNDKTSEK